MPKVLRVPLDVILSLTNKCTMKCKHCFASSGIISYHEMDLNEWKNTVDKVSDVKILGVTFSGGEPLMLPWFPKLLEHTISKRISCSLNTNAALVDDDMASFLASAPLRGIINVSFDGADAETYESLRGVNAYDDVLRGIHALVRHGLAVRLSCVVNKYNFTKMLDITKKALELGCKNIDFNGLCVVGTCADYEKEITLNYEEIVYVYKNMMELFEVYGNFVGGTIYNCAKMYFTYLERKKAGKHINSSLNSVGCGNGKTSMVIYSDGHVSPCEMLKSKNCGNIFKQSLSEIWNTSKIMNDFRKLYNTPLSNLQNCSDCFVNDICLGGCRAIPYLNGNILGTDPSCLRSIIEECD